MLKGLQVQNGHVSVSSGARAACRPLLGSAYTQLVHHYERSRQNNEYCPPEFVSDLYRYVSRALPTQKTFICKKGVMVLSRRK